MHHASAERPAEPLPTAVGLELELRAGLEPEEATRRAEQALRVGDLAARVSCFYLADLARREGWKALGSPNLRHFARHRLRRGYSTVKEYVRTGLELLRPEVRPIDEAFAAGRLVFSAVKQLVGVAQDEAGAAEWAAWASGRSCSEVAAEVKRRGPGGRPGKGEARRIHEERIRLVLDLSPADYLLWERFRAKSQAEAGGALTDLELALHAMRIGLCLEADGSVPGWKRVNATHYQIHARPAPGGEPDRLVAMGEDGEEVEVSRAALTREPFASPATALVTEGRAVVDLAAIDPRNHGALVPLEERDEETRAPLRTKALVRDGYRCVCCGGRENLTVHHVHWRRYGGRTELVNLIVLCETCHSMVHARLMVVTGDVEAGLEFLDRTGRPFAHGPVAAVAIRTSGWEGAGASAGAGVTPLVLTELPAEVDAAWVRRHAELLRWNERLGVMELVPGNVREADDGARFGEAQGVDAGKSDAGAPRLRLGDLVGQEEVRERLGRAIAAAGRRRKQLRHHLLSGGPGLGKTSLAEAIAGELGVPLVRLPAPLVSAPDALLRALVSLRAGQVLFMDEVQALGRRLGEALYEALDTGVLSLPVRQGVLQRTLRVRLEPFTFVGATTDEDQLAGPLRGRLVRERLDFYSEAELAEVLARAARAQGLELAPEGARRLARASRGTPREGLRLLEDVTDEATLAEVGAADAALVERALERRGVDAQGLDPLDRAYLAVLEGARGPVSLRTLAAELGAPEGELRLVREPWLQRQGWVRVTPRGRVLRPRRKEAAGGRR